MQTRSSLLPLGMVVLFAALPNLGQAAAALPNFSIPGVPLPGYPHFENTASITLAKTGGTFAPGTTRTYQLTSANIPSTFLFQYNPASAWTVNGTFSFTADLSVTGTSAPVLTGGTVSVNGTIPGYAGPQPSQTLTGSAENLFSANLVPGGFGTDLVTDATPVALGFKTDSFSGWASQFSNGSPESVYLYSFNVPGLVSMFNNPKFKHITFRGAALTTVPVPAAAWLFGSALALFTGMRRKKAVAA